MRTRPGSSRRRWFAVSGGVVGGLLALAVFGQEFVAVGASAIDPASYRLSSEDLGNLGDIAFGEPPTVAIKPDAAVAAAAAVYDPKALGATSVGAYLETVTVGDSAAEDRPVGGQGVWIIKMAGMALAQGAPVSGDGKPGEGRILTTAYVFLDAGSGEFLMTVWTE